MRHQNDVVVQYARPPDLVVIDFIDLQTVGNGVDPLARGDAADPCKQSSLQNALLIVTNTEVSNARPSTISSAPTTIANQSIPRPSSSPIFFFWRTPMIA